MRVKRGDGRGQESLEPMLGSKRVSRTSKDTRRDEIGLVNGLAWTAVGGETMPIEVASWDGSGKIELYWKFRAT